MVIWIVVGSLFVAAPVKGPGFYVLVDSISGGKRAYVIGRPLLTVLPQQEVTPIILKYF